MSEFEYKPKYAVIVMCKDEDEQKAGTKFSLAHKDETSGGHSWYGGHFRAVQGFAYLGVRNA